jgi:hypothetical protein
VSFQKKLAMCDLIVSIVHLGNLMIDIRYIGILVRQALSKSSLAPYDKSILVY